MAGTPRYKRKYIDGRSSYPISFMVTVSEDGRFSKIPLKHIGFSEDVTGAFMEAGIGSLGDILSRSPSELSKMKELSGCSASAMDTLDQYFDKAFEKGKQLYSECPVPVCQIIGVRDPRTYSNCLLYDFGKEVRSDLPDLLDVFRRHGIITLYDLLTMDLTVWHECMDCDDACVRGWLIVLQDLMSRYGEPAHTILMPFPLNDPALKPSIYTGRAKGKVFDLTDSRIAGEDVSPDGLTSHEKALYDRVRSAIEDCGADFYNDVVENREAYALLAKSLRGFWPAELELLQRRTAMRNLYMAIPEQLRKMPVRALYHYMVPRCITHDVPSPDMDYVKYTRDTPFFRRWEPFHRQDRMLALEDAFRHMEELVYSCSTLEEYDRMLSEDRNWAFLDLLDWLGGASMLGAAYDNFMRTDYMNGHRVPEAMKECIPDKDPDETIEELAVLAGSRPKKVPDAFPYYKSSNPYPSRWYGFESAWHTSRYDFFAVYMMLTGATEVPFDTARRIIPRDAEKLRVLIQKSADETYLYEYNPATDMITMKPHALQW